jgi:hypothetical protein
MQDEETYEGKDVYLKKSSKGGFARLSVQLKMNLAKEALDKSALP